MNQEQRLKLKFAQEREMLGEDGILEWRQHPGTKLMFLWLEVSLEEMKEMMIDGMFPETYKEQVSKCDTIKDVISYLKGEIQTYD